MAEGQSSALGVLGEQKWVPQPAKQTVVRAALRTHVAEPCGIWEVLGFIPSVLGGFLAEKVAF